MGRMSVIEDHEPSMEIREYHIPEKAPHPRQYPTYNQYIGWE